MGILGDLEVRDLSALAGAMRASLSELLAAAQAETESAVGTSPSGSADSQTATRIDRPNASEPSPLPSAPRPI